MRRNRAEMAMMVTASVPSKKRRRASDNQHQKRSGKGAGGVQQVRRSGRARKAVASYADDDKFFEMVVEEKNRSPRGQPTYSPPDPEPDVEFVSARSLPDTSGRKRDANGCLVFDDEPDFRPNLSPQQMIASGIFGGCYFNPSGGKKGIKYPRGGIPIDHREYPDEWFCDLPASMYVSKRYDVSTNRYKVSRVVWFLWRRHVIDDSSLTLRLRRQQQQQRWKTGERPAKTRRFGRRRGGSIPRTLAAGFSGTLGFFSAGAQRTTRGRSQGGGGSRARRVGGSDSCSTRSLGPTLTSTTPQCPRWSGKRCCTGYAGDLSAVFSLSTR